MSSEFRVFLDAQAQLWLQRPNQSVQSLESLSEAERRSVQIVWVPTQQLAIGQQFVPGKRQADWMAALPFAVEEQLSRPIEEYHLAVLHREAVQIDEAKGQQITFAAVSHEWMQAWQAVLLEHGLHKAYLVADCFALKSHLDGADSSVALSYKGEQQTLYRWGAAMGAALPNGLPISENLDWQEVATLSQSQLLPADLRNLRAFNLLQGTYAPQGGASLNIWRTPAIAGLLVLVLLGVNTYLSTQKMVQDAQLYQAQTQALFQQMFPDVKRVVNIRAQTLNRLKNSESKGGVETLMPLLLPLQKVLQPVKSVTIAQLRWSVTGRGAQLSLDLSAGNSQILQQLEQKLQQQMPNAKIALSLKKVESEQVTGELNVEPI